MHVLLRFGLLGTMLVLMAGCSNTTASSSDGSASNGTANAQTASTPAGATSTSATAATPQGGTATNTDTPDTIDPKDLPKDGDKVAVIETNYGTIIFKFIPDKAPKTVQNFQDLAEKKFYDGTKFHRVIPGMMIQGGDPNTKSDQRNTYGHGGPGYSVKAEFSDLKHVPGIVSMARAQDPDSAGSQFFIMVHDYPSLDGKYTIFGKVVKGMDVVNKIVSLPRDADDDPNPGNEATMKSVTIKTWPVKG
jgi:peptidyl-prolyl cis-trans isomerase B (cyclophilin B)